MNRGSEEDAEHPREGFAGFNEAPIHESGKWGTDMNRIKSLI